MGRTSKQNSSEGPSRPRPAPYPLSSSSRSASSSQPSSSKSQSRPASTGSLGRVSQSGTNSQSAASSSTSVQQSNRSADADRNTAGPDSSRFKEHILDVDVLVDPGDKRPRPIELKTLCLRWATGPKMGQVASIEDLDPGIPNGELAPSFQRINIRYPSCHLMISVSFLFSIRWTCE